MKKKLVFNNIINLIVSFLLAFSINLKFNVDYTSKYPEVFINKFNFDAKFFVITILLSFLIYIFLNLLFRFLDKFIKIRNDGKFDSKKLFIITFFSIFIFGLIFLLVYYPGVGMNDTLIIIDSPLAASSQHPLFYNLWLSLTYRIFFKLVSSSNLAFFFTSLTQLVIIDSIISFLIVWFNNKFQNRKCTLFLFCYFSFLPIITNHNVVLIKDSLFSSVLLLFIPLLYEILRSQGKSLTRKKFLFSTLLIFVAAIYIRNNGIYVVSLIIFYIFIRYKKYWKNTLFLLLSILLFYKIPSFILPTNEPLFQEKIGIPIQQISYVIKNNYDSISYKDKKYLNDIIPADSVRENYNPYSVDPIKWNKNFDRLYLNKTKKTYIKTWFTILKNNFNGYVKGYLLMTYELWSIEKFNPVQSRFFNIDKDSYQGSYFNNLNNISILPNTIKNFMDIFYKNTTIFFNNGLCFIILLIISTYIINRKKDLLLITLPLFGVWFTLMISAPISYALRYMSSYIYLLPFVILISIISVKKIRYQ